MTRPTIPHRVIRASAGSGKTYRLTNHYLALLAAEEAPAHIWAATFTRKAAGEIFERIVERLLTAARDDAKAVELAGDIACPGKARADFAEMLRVLFADLHRLRIGTLDSLFLNLAGTFPFELGLPPGWGVCDEADAAEDREVSLDAVLAAGPDRIEWLERTYSQLARGEARRGVRDTLLEGVKHLYQAYRDVPQGGWRTELPEPTTERLGDLLDELAAFDLSANMAMAKARDRDVERARNDEWEAFAGTGVAGKVFAGEGIFNRKGIPSDLAALYQRVKPFAARAILAELADELNAAREFLEAFDRHCEAARQTGGGLRFDDVTRALARGLDRLADGFDYRLGCRVAHLLLDEFQDTATAQWRVLKPLAVRAMAAGTFFGVGDVKQAIYGWRGGRVELLDRLTAELGLGEAERMDHSRRSSGAVIETVNRVFGKLDAYVSGGTVGEAAASWQKLYGKHTTERTGVVGYACIEIGPAQVKREKPGEQPVELILSDLRKEHYRFVADKVAALVAAKPEATVGVLCRTNAAVGRMIYELRRAGVSASEEGGNPITDSPAVETLLSLFVLADHPGDSVARFHLVNGPLIEALRRECYDPADAPEFSLRFRDDLVVRGYGPVVARWAAELARVCPQEDRLRLAQLVDVANAYRPRATLRPADFVAWVRGQRVAAPSSSRVRVMTLHKAKGLEFHAVVLPELDVNLKGRPGPFAVADADPPGLPHGYVGRRVAAGLRPLLDAETVEQCEAAEQREVGESLSLLYVALTRAKDALYLFPPGPHKRGRTDYWDTLLLKALCPAQADVKGRESGIVAFEEGNAGWQPDESTEPAAVMAARPDPRFRSSNAARRKPEWVSPSHLEGGRRIDVARLFDSSGSTGRQTGTLHHLWFAEIEWLDGGGPSDEALRRVARLLPYVEGDLAEQIAAFRAALARPAIRAALSRAAYPGAFRVERERPFNVRDGNRLLNGSIDRLVWSRAPDGAVTAEVLDFKTDAVSIAGLPERVAHYAPQVAAYARAVAAFGKLPPESVTAALLFTVLGRVERPGP